MRKSVRSERELSQCFREDVIKSGFCVPKRLVYVLHRPIRRKADTAGRRSWKDGDVVKFDGGVNAEFDFYTYR